MHLKGRGAVHTYRCSIPESTHTLPQLNGSGLIKPAIPPPACATVLTFEKNQDVSHPKGGGAADILFQHPNTPCPMRHNTITLTLIKRTLYM